ncbi:hypothetical protein K8R04_04390 [Candidatus Uhrbacteria bacterium]|nr:hypothetical protein [Candidatus Uhrbacteria bacterium]
MTKWRSLFRRKADDHPPFTPEVLDQYVVREAHVTHWARLNRFMVSVVLETPLYSHRMRGLFLARRLRFGFEDAERPFSIKEATVQEATIAFCVNYIPADLGRFMRSDPLLLQSVLKPEVKLRIPTYTFSVFEVPKPAPPDSDGTPL